MKTLLTMAVLFSLFTLLLPCTQQQAPDSHRITLNGHTFTLPPGFTIEVAAKPPLVDRPITAAFDEQGRLYVAESSGSSEPVKVQLEKKPHRILRLEDSDGDGRFDKRTIFADRMMFPEGTMWHKGSLYVSAPPEIWKLTDTNDDGVADKREVWFDGKTLTGCANDLHGPYLGPDGLIYWCKGAFAEQHYVLPTGKKFTTKAAHIFRARSDATAIEPVMTGGMDNPVDVVFTPGGERIFTTTFLQFPGGGKRDGLIHAVYGGVYGKDYHVNHDHIWTSPHLMPVLSHLGPAAPAGLERYQSAVFGKEYQDNLFACCFNLQKITRHVLMTDGATFKSRDLDFLVSDQKDFHPTDVLEDADGSLLVVDTGGWYKLCCPTSQLYKPDILGAIYRVRRIDAPRIDDPRGLKIDWAKNDVFDTATLLGDGRPAVRQRAIQTLADKGLSAVVAIEKLLNSDSSIESRRNAVWTATLIEGESARRAVRKALADPEETVRQAALHSISVHRDKDAVPGLIKMLENPSLHNRRAAAEALGRIGDRSAITALLSAMGKTGDRVLQHSLTYALIEIGATKEISLGLSSDDPMIRRAALTALDQLGKNHLKPEAVLKELDSKDATLRESAWWIAGRHPEWGDQLAEILEKRINDGSLRPEERSDLARQLAKLSSAKRIQKLLAEQISNESTAESARRTALLAIGMANLKVTPPAWLDALTEVLKKPQDELIAQTLATVRALRHPKQPHAGLLASLERISTDVDNSANVRLSALAAIPRGLTKVDELLFSFIVQQLQSQESVSNRSLSADILSQVRLNGDQLIKLAETLPAVGPMERDRVLEAFKQSNDDAVGKHLLVSLTAIRGHAVLREEKLRPIFEKYSPQIRKQADELFASLRITMAEQAAKLDELLALTKNGSIHRGQQVFNSTKAACITCHSIGYIGGKIAPDLTRIGQIRTERDLLEAIVFPSASFVRSYEPVFIVTRDGKSHNGLLQSESAQEVVLTLGADQQIRIARDDIEEMQLGTVSIMPAGLDQQLTPQELADLVAFLKACR